MKSDINYNIKAIPTKYNGTLYRSRLEAKWAAFFDMVGIKFQYEPFDLDGWTPDFLLMGKIPILVEVKPIIKFNISAWNELAKHHSKHDGETMLLGNFIERDSIHDYYSSGWLMEKYLDDDNNKTSYDYIVTNIEDNGCDYKFNYGWSENTNSVDIFHATGSFRYRLSGEYDGDGHLNDPDSKGIDLELLFKEAQNKVQHKY